MVAKQEYVSQKQGEDLFCCLAILIQKKRKRFGAFLSQVSDVISVRLLSGTSAVLNFRCSSHSVQLPLSAVPYRIQPNESVSLPYRVPIIQ